MNRLDQDEITVAAEQLARPLVMAFADLFEAKGPRIATVTLVDVCSRTLSFALMPLSEDGRRKALALLVEETLALAADNDGSFAAQQEVERGKEPKA